ncbi:MAG: hypothetical protein ACXWC7_02655 [Chitinophagaceae bacterium]
MEIVLSIAVADHFFQHKTYLVHKLSALAIDFFKVRNYSLDLDTITISFIFVKSRPGYEDWYKEKSPRYVSFKTGKSRLTGEIYEIKKRFSYDIKFSDELLDRFKIASDMDSMKMIARETLASVYKLDVLVRRINGFDKRKFVADLQEFFDHELGNLIE